MKILVVDDERDLSNAITKVLKLEQYEVTQAYDGLEAIDYVSNENFDLIIMDVMMPNLDGISATKHLREKGIQTPILLLTARSLTEDKVQGLDSGADDYLTKPFRFEELKARIRALLRRGTLVSLTLDFCDIKLDPNSFSLIGPKGEARLTNKEYKLLELFIKNKNMFVQTEKIIDSVWDFESDVDVSVVWVFISSLRKHLAKVGSVVEIKSSRGIGYRLEAKND